jgi:p-cumate 2,3-dioxygenase subunit beta
VTQTLPLYVGDTGVSVTDPVLLSRITQFLYVEAQLLDEWRLEDWLALMHPDISYRVPAPGSEQLDPSSTLQIISDNYLRLSGRVTRLKSKHAHAESPKSHTRRMVSNVRAERAPDGSFVSHANFHVLRVRLAKLDHFIGSYRHTLVESEEPDGGGFLVRERIATLDHGIDKAGGTVSIIL